jgi:hypothetical protein
MYNHQLRQQVLVPLLLRAAKEKPPMKVKREKAKERKPKNRHLLRPNNPK